MRFVKDKYKVINVLISLLISGFYYRFIIKEIYNIFEQNYDYQKIRLPIACIFGYIILNIIILTIGYFIKNRSKHKLFIKHFLIYFGIMLVFLFLSWPGMFRGDEYYVIPRILSLEIQYNQSLYTCLFYLISLCIIPTVGGITFFQILIISIIVGYILGNIEKILKNKKLVYLLYICLLLPPVIDNNLFTLRSSLISYFFLLTIFELIFYKNDKNYYRLFIAVFFSIIVGRWKIEFIYLPIFVIIYCFIMFRKNFETRNFCYAVFLAIGLLFALGYAEVKENYYAYTAALNPLSILATYDDIKTTIPEKDVKNIEKLVSFKKLKKMSNYYNIEVVHDINYLMDGKDKVNFFISYGKLVFHNPIRFLKARYLTFAATNYPKKTDRISQTGWEYFEAQWKMRFYWKNSKTEFDMNKKIKYVKNPLGMKFKKWFVCTLLMRNYNDYSPNIFNHIFYNVVPPTFISIILLIIFLIKKEKEKLLIIITILTQLPLIFITVPGSFWMYYMPLYLNLYFLIFYWTIEYLDYKKIS